MSSSPSQASKRPAADPIEPDSKRAKVSSSDDDSDSDDEWTPTFGDHVRLLDGRRAVVSRVNNHVMTLEGPQPSRVHLYVGYGTSLEATIDQMTFIHSALKKGDRVRQIETGRVGKVSNDMYNRIDVYIDSTRELKSVYYGAHSMYERVGPDAVDELVVKKGYTWREGITKELANHGETWADIEKCTLTDEELDVEFNNGYGRSKGKHFTAWSKKRVLGPGVYDGREWVFSVPRNPDPTVPLSEQATKHVGGE